MKKCKEDDCKERHYSLGFCRNHYRQFSYYRNRGTKKKNWPKICTVIGCGKVTRVKGLCNAHYLRKKRLGDPTVPKKYAPAGSGHKTAMGYRKIYVEDGRHILEHRYVMEKIIGRKLLPTESVHHLNGDKSDNKPSNLEMWNRTQPAGQRVEDKVSWAIDLLKLYAPGMLA